ncbi:hypothetical protein BJ742DRAFT_37873 [Cladochytrium replicatum]|nr:hypothetical protein BJ742DRAFT_37873 [Cladochytrium replicatum]
MRLPSLRKCLFYIPRSIPTGFFSVVGIFFFCLPFWVVGKSTTGKAKPIRALSARLYTKSYCVIALKGSFRAYSQSILMWDTEKLHTHFAPKSLQRLQFTALIPAQPWPNSPNFVLTSFRFLFTASLRTAPRDRNLQVSVAPAMCFRVLSRPTSCYFLLPCWNALIG